MTSCTNHSIIRLELRRAKVTHFGIHEQAIQKTRKRAQAPPTVDASAQKPIMPGKFIKN
jgi:hypothetical protein